MSLYSSLLSKGTNLKYLFIMNSKIILWWIGKNYNQLFILFFLIFFCAQICRIIITNVFNF